MTHYERFSPEDFAMDPKFVKWVRDPHDNDREFWDEWLVHHPDKAHVLSEARRLVALLKYNVAQPGRDAKAKVKANIDRILSEHQSRPAAPTRNLNWYRWAAALTGILAVALIGVMLLNPSESVVSTGYGETETVILEDGSAVTLNGNSSIRYMDLADGTAREVQLSGEAFFQIKPMQDQRKFIVLADKLRVEVLGTEFNVNSRLGKTSVVLRSGSVNVAVGETDNADALTMVPGDMVEYAEDAGKLVQKAVDPSHHMSWTNNVLVFDAVSIQEIATLLNHTYGYNVTVAEEVGSLLFTGTVPSDNLGILFSGLRKTHGLEIVVEENDILIGR